MSGNFIFLSNANAVVYPFKSQCFFFNIAGGYFYTANVNDPKLTNEVLIDGIVYTSDIGYKDNEGFIYVSGRKGDVINVGGIKVSPSEVEEAAFAFEGIDDCICIAQEDKITGQALKLLVVMHQGYTLNSRKIREFLSSRIEAVKVPRFYEQVEKIERTYNGKINRKFYR